MKLVAIISLLSLSTLEVELTSKDFGFPTLEANAVSMMRSSDSLTERNLRKSHKKRNKVHHKRRKNHKQKKEQTWISKKNMHIIVNKVTDMIAANLSKKQ